MWQDKRPTKQIVKREHDAHTISAARGPPCEPLQMRKPPAEPAEDVVLHGVLKDTKGLARQGTEGAESPEEAKSHQITTSKWGKCSVSAEGLVANELGICHTRGLRPLNHAAGPGVLPRENRAPLKVLSLGSGILLEM